jgi:hypothetical protein
MDGVVKHPSIVDFEQKSATIRNDGNGNRYQNTNERKDQTG